MKLRRYNSLTGRALVPLAENLAKPYRLRKESPRMLVTLGDHCENLIRNLVESGRYPNADTVVCAGLWLMQEREARRQAELDDIRAGRVPGPGWAGD